MTIWEKVRPYFPSFLCGLVGGVLVEIAPYVAGYIVPGSEPYRFIEEWFTGMGANPVVAYFGAVILVVFVIFLLYLVIPWGPRTTETKYRKALFYVLNFIAWDIGMIAAVGVWVLGLIILWQTSGPLSL